MLAKLLNILIAKLICRYAKDVTKNDNGDNVDDDNGGNDVENKSGRVVCCLTENFGLIIGN